MRRFGDPDSFLSLIERIRGLAPDAGIRSSVIVGFPGERDADVEILADFVQEARLDALGVFGYSDEEGTEAEGLADHLPEHVVAERAERLSDLAAELVDQRAADRVGERVQVLIEGVEDAAGPPGGQLTRALMSTARRRSKQPRQPPWAPWSGVGS